MDVQFWIWLIIIVVTLIARARKSRPKEQPRQEADRDLQEQGQRPLTFDELLREIQSAKQAKDLREALPPPEPFRPYRQPEPVFQEVDYDDNIGEEEQDLETAIDDTQRTNDVYERAKQQAFSRPSLEDTMKLEDTVMKFGHFKGYDSQEEKSPMADLLAEFKDPNGLKKAFLMSEILRTKF